MMFIREYRFFIYINVTFEVQIYVTQRNNNNFFRKFKNIQ